jgi:hypothetical protein
VAIDAMAPCTYEHLSAWMEIPRKIPLQLYKGWLWDTAELKKHELDIEKTYRIADIWVIELWSKMVELTLVEERRQNVVCEIMLSVTYS